MVSDSFPPRDVAADAIIWRLVNSTVSARALYLVAELGIADHIDDVPVTPAELARRCSLDSRALDRILRLLAKRIPSCLRVTSIAPWRSM